MPRRASARARTGGASRRTCGSIGRALVITASLLVVAVVLTGACVTVGSLAARSVLRTGMPTTVAAAIRTDADRDFADRMNRIEIVTAIPEEESDTAPEWQLASAESRPAESRQAGPCDGVSADTLASRMAPADLATAASVGFTAAPCLTGDELRAAALVLPADALHFARPPAPAPVLAMAVATAPDERTSDRAGDYTGSIPSSVSLPAAAPPRPRRDELSGYPASLAALDGRTAVYDIVGHTVYLPDGTKLEAHSGLGAKRDDPRYAHVRMHGVTPPNLYDLRLREALFHGVRAIRLTPVEKGKMFGRDGILAHTYMLGPNGQSNGCVSFRNYPAFLDAFLKGEVKRIVVVAKLPAPPTRAMLRGIRDQVAMNSE